MNILSQSGGGNPLRLEWEPWFYGLFNGIIGGAATSGGAWLGMSGAKAAGLDVPVLNWKALGVIMASGALTNLFFYLKQSPLPAIETTTTTTIATTITETKPNPAAQDDVKTAIPLQNTK